MVTVRVSPNARQSTVTGTTGDYLTCRLNAKPVDGAANTELLRLLTDQLGVPKSRLSMLSGETSRLKRVLITGITVTNIHTALTRG